MLHYSTQTRSNWIWLPLAILLGAAIATSIALEPLIILASIGGALGIYLTYKILKNPFWGLLLIAFFLPFERVGAVEISGMSVRISQALALITLSSWIGHKLVKGKLSFKSNPLFWPLFAFLLINLLSFVNSLNMMRSVLVLSFTLFVIIISFMVAEIIDTKDKLVQVVKVLVWSAALVSLFGIFQWVGDMIGLPHYITLIRVNWYDKSVVGMTRLHSTALEPLYFANYLLVVLPVVTGLILGYTNKEKPEQRTGNLFPLWFLLGAGIVMGLAFLLTMSRGGYVALAMSIMVLVIFRFSRVFSKRLIILLFIACCAAAGVLGVLSAGQSDLSVDWIIGRVTSYGETSADWERLETYSDAFNAFTASPWLGVGTGNFGAYQTGVDIGTPDNGWGIVNNEPLELLAEVGLFGFTALVVALMFWTINTFRALKATRDPLLRILLAGSLATLAGFCVQYITFSTLYIMHIWFALGLGVALQNLVLQRKNV